MKKIIFTQFCCGCSVQAGTILIGVFDVIASVISLVLLVLSVHNGGMENFSKQILYIDLIPSMLSLIISSILIYGAWKGRSSLILPWLIFYLVYTILLLISGVTQIIHVLILSQFALGIEILLLLIVLGSIVVYFYITVYSHYLNLIDGVSELPRPPVVMLV